MNCTKSSLKGVNVLRRLTFALQFVADRAIFRAFDLGGQEGRTRGNPPMGGPHDRPREEDFSGEEDWEVGVGKRGKRGRRGEKICGGGKKVVTLWAFWP